MKRTVTTTQRSIKVLAASLVVVAMVAAPRPAQGQDDLETLEERAFQAAVERVAPSVVRIETIGGLERVGGVDFGTGPTTGLIVEADGYLVSSAFGFANRPDSILVQLADGTRHAAKRVATDHNRMLVLLKIDAPGPLPVPDIVPESEIQVGQWAVAVGRTYQSDRPNRAVGIVSARNRVWGKALQTDAAVSPANYGGPLVDVGGRVLGVLVPLSPQAANEMAGLEWYDSGIGFAVPGYDVLSILPRLKRGEDLSPGLIGVSFPKGNPSTTEPVVAACHPNSPAAESGIESGDKIVEVEGRAIVRTSQFKEELGRRYAGDTIGVAVVRSGKRSEHELTLLARLEPYEHPFLGILPMRAMRPSVDRPGPRGVLVRYVYPGSPAAEIGLEPGDLIESLAQEPLRSADSLRERLTRWQPDDEVDLAVRRAGEIRKHTVRLGRLPDDLPSEKLPPPRDMAPLDQKPPPAPAKPDSAEPPQTGPIGWKLPEFSNEIWAYVPERDDRAARYGLVVWLHGANPYDWDALLARWKPHADARKLILVAPKAAGSRGWQARDAEMVGKLIRDVNASYRLDPSRLVVHGQATGGRLAYLVAFGNRDWVRAVATVGASLTGRPPQNDPMVRLAFYTALATGARDAGRTRKGVAFLRKMKYPVVVHELGEKPRALAPAELAELVRWIDTLDRI